MGVLGRMRGSFGLFLIFSGMMNLVPAMARGQMSVAPQPATVAAVMVSDLHFDPLHDPAKVPLLVKAPVEQWEKILKSPDSATQAAEFAAVQKTCGGRQVGDTPYTLLSGVLRAAKAQAPDAQFVTVSGDLLVHTLDCRYRAAMKLPKAAGDDQSVSAAFAEKTTVFVMKQVESAFAGIPVYLALGNNDSRCNHNRMDVHDDYLKETAHDVIDGLVGATGDERKLALATYESSGYYGVTMPSPMERTRMLVLDNTFMMSGFANCEADATDRRGAQEQIDWLKTELNRARQRGEQVWVLGHVPPEITPPGSPAEKLALCGAGRGDANLSSDDLANALTNHADVVRLALFGHTHSDELHLLGSKAAGVPVKVVPSVTAAGGNIPSFTVGKVAPASAMLIDYAVYEASNPTGVGATWAREYDFDEEYHETSFSAPALASLIGRFRADTYGSGAESWAYRKHSFKGAPTPMLQPNWETYVCSLDHPTPDGFKACACAGK